MLPVKQFKTVFINMLLPIDWYKNGHTFRNINVYVLMTDTILTYEFVSIGVNLIHVIGSPHFRDRSLLVPT